MSEEATGWQPGTFRHSAGEAFLWSLSLYALPSLGSDVLVPLGLVFPMMLKEAAPLSDLLPLLGWQTVLAAAHLWRIRSNGWRRRLTWAPIAIMTAGPLYWFLFWLPPSPEEIAEKRQPEHGDWEEVCRIEGPYSLAPTSRAATNAGEAWIGESNEAWEPIGLSKMSVQNTCNLELVDKIPRKAHLLSGHRGQRAVFRVDDTFFGLSAEAESPVELWKSDLIQAHVLSEDGEWVAWTYDVSRRLDESPHELVAQRLDDSDRRSTLLHLSPDKPYASRLLEYDPISQVTTLELPSGGWARVDASGRVVSRSPQPAGCQDRWLGTWYLHDAGWAYSGIPGCKLAWDLDGNVGRLDFQGHMGQLPEDASGSADVSISPDGGLIAFTTNVMVGHHSSSPESVCVIRVQDASELARIHLRPNRFGGWGTTARFLGPDHLLVSERGLVRLIRLHL